MRSLAVILGAFFLVLMAPIGFWLAFDAILKSGLTQGEQLLSFIGQLCVLPMVWAAFLLWSNLRAERADSEVPSH